MPQDTNTATEHLALPQSKAASDVQAVPLVQRLRNTPNWRRESYGHWKDMTSEYDRAPFEAADEIERLRASHSDLVKALEGLLALPVAIEELRMLGRGIGTATPNAAWLVARAALDNARKVTQ